MSGLSVFVDGFVPGMNPRPTAQRGPWLKPHTLGDWFQGLKGAAEKELIPASRFQKLSSGAKALLILWALSARLKSYPDTKLSIMGFFRSL